MRNSIRKKITSFVIAFCLLLSGVGLLNFGVINLKTSATASSESMSYYYAQLSDKEKRFYDALDKMKTDGVLKTNGAFDLVENEVVSQKEIFEYSDGNSALLKQFRNAKDAFELDHPEVFWVDFDLISLSLGKKGDDFTATIDAGRYDSYFVKGFSVATLESEIEDFNGDDGVKRYLPTDEGLSVVEMVEFVAEEIAYSTKYSYIDSQNIQVLNSAYGATMAKLATSEGFAKTFKLCMDLMGFECVQVNGYVASEKEASVQAHNWNYVKVLEKWYAVDVALNEKTGSSTNILCGQEFLQTHFEEQIISTDGKQFKLPTLANESYYNSNFLVNAGVSNGEFVVEFSYDGKSATELATDGLFLVVFNESSLDNSRVDFGTGKAWNFHETEAESKSKVAVSAFVPLVKVGVTTVAPNSSGEYSELLNEDLICYQVVENELYFADESLKRPWVESIKAETLDSSIVYDNASNVKLDALKTWKITVTYDEALRKANPSAAVSMVAEILNDDSNIKSYIEISEVVWNEETPEQITFNFTPSKLLKHDGAEYVFMPFNFMNTSGIDLRPVYSKLSFERTSLSASRIMNEESVYISSVTKPTLIDSSEIDLIADGWKNSVDVTFNGNQREQLTLVSEKPNQETSTTMLNNIKTTFEYGANDILSSDLFMLHLNIDGVVSNVPVNAYLQYAFAYPKGYTFESMKKGVEFKVYTFEKDVYGAYDYSKPVEINSVATENGIVISTNACGCVAVVAVKSNNEQTSQVVYSRAINAGGTIECVGEINAQNKISVVSGESIAYSIVAEQGYQIDYVLVNGKNVTSKIKNGVLTLLKTELIGNNVVEVAFVSNSVVEVEQTEGITNLDASFAANEQAVYVPKEKTDTQKDNTVLIVVIVSISVAVAIAAIVTTIVLVKKKVLKNKK